jgi:hypothetical protein
MVIHTDSARYPQRQDHRVDLLSSNKASGFKRLKLLVRRTI